jgi:hypothetical protein
MKRARLAEVHAVRCAVVLVVALLELRVDLRAQTSPEAIVARLHAYIDAYEPKLSQLVADESFDQRLRYTRTYTRQRRLASDIGFLRLPGGSVWLAQRNVRTVDGRPVPGAVPRLDDAIAKGDAEAFRRAREIAEANARHNLGHPRTINVPTLPLELLSRRHAAQYDVVFDGGEPGSRARDTMLMFRERPPGAVIAYDRNRFNLADVQARVRLRDGALLMARVVVRAPVPNARRHRISVYFGDEAALGMLVPIRLTEDFYSEGDGSGEATYRNYRRFQTSGRILPPL